MLFIEKGLEEIWWVLDSLFTNFPNFKQSPPKGIYQAIGYKYFIELYEANREREKEAVIEELFAKKDHLQNPLLIQAIRQLEKATMKLMVQQKKWIKNRLLSNSLIKNGSLFITINKEEMGSKGKEQYFGEIADRLVLFAPKKITTEKTDRNLQVFHCSFCNK